MSVESSVAAAMERMLGAVVYLAISTPVDQSREFQIPPETLRAHIRYQAELEQRGVLFAAGPLVEPDGHFTGVGIEVVRAQDEAEAHRIIAADPIHAKGLRTFTVLGWRIHEGRISASFDFSTGRFTLT